jgi:hypothetical protein
MGVTPNFKPSKAVKELPNGKVRDGSFDDAVRMAWAEPGKVFEDIAADKDTADEYRKGLARSAKWLHDEHKIPVRVTDHYEDEMVDEKDEKGKLTGNKIPSGRVLVYFAAVEKRPSPRGKKAADVGEQTELPETADENAGEMVNA